MLIKELTSLNGVSGNEEEVREFIINNAKGLYDNLQVDSIGNVIIYKKGINSTKKIMLASHMDEVGFMATSISDNGLIKFKSIGGLDDRILPGKRVLIGKNKIPGVIGIKSIHLQTPEERTANIKQKNMYIDIGADSKEAAEKLTELGDYIAFYSEYSELGSSTIKAKALDDRVGCACLLELLKDEFIHDTYFCFTVQEEIGLRGAKIAAYKVQPDIAFIVEGTTCNDVPDTSEHNYSTMLGEGVAITIMDRAAYADKALVRFIRETAKRLNIKFQYKKTVSGGNDAGRIQTANQGVKTAVLSVPIRYIHSPVSMMNKKDYESLKELLKGVLNKEAYNV